MDDRTREKYLKAARIRMRLLEGRASGLPYGADWMAALEEGRIAADRLEAEMVRQELRRVKELAESLRMDRDAARALIAKRDALRAVTTPLLPAPARPAKAAAASHRYPARVCPQCGKEFFPEYFTSVYCGDICRRAAHRAKAAAKKAPDTVSSVVVAAPAETTMHSCERMHLKTLSPLPCGKHVACFGDPRCERCPDEAVPVLPPVTSDAWGIGRSLPRGDVQ